VLLNLLKPVFGRKAKRQFATGIHILLRVTAFSLNADWLAEAQERLKLKRTTPTDKRGRAEQQKLKRRSATFENCHIVLSVS